MTEHEPEHPGDWKPFAGLLVAHRGVDGQILAVDVGRRTALVRWHSGEMTVERVEDLRVVDR